ncbi:uncharacterized protein LOC144441108 isoform X2 [Glandiceps talaboti]
MAETVDSKLEVTEVAIRASTSREGLVEENNEQSATIPEPSQSCVSHDKSITVESGSACPSTSFENTQSNTNIRVFFSYSSKDREWVEETVTRLEAEHGITCVFDERDFIGGKPVVENIIACIQNSDKTVLVLTEDFLNSPWCTYEAQLTLREHLIREQSVVLPVLLKECTIPDFISHLTCLDARRQSFWEKFIDFLESDPVEIVPKGSFFGHEAAKFNGKVLSMVKLNGCCTFNSINYKEILDSLCDKGIRISEDTMMKTEEAIRRSGLSKCFCCVQCTRSFLACFCWIPMFLIISFLFIFAIFELIILIENRDVGNTSDVDYFDVIVFFLLPMSICIIMIIWRFKMRMIRDAGENGANSVLMDSNILFSTIRERKDRRIPTTDTTSA